MGQRLLVIGGDAGGMAVATEARRRDPDLEIVALEKGRWTSYSACGIPYLAGGAVRATSDLVVRTPEQFRGMRIDARVQHEVVGLDLAARRAEVHNLAHGRTFQLGFDRLHIATGARPHRPDVEGMDLPHVHGVQTLDDATALLDDAGRRQPRRVVVVGSGYVGLEMAEAFLQRGAQVTVVEAEPEVMASLDPAMGALVARAMRDMGITVRVDDRVTGITPSAVATESTELPADLVVLGLGVEPDSALAAGVGIATGERGGIVVDRRQATSVEGVWAAGDCCQSIHRITGAPVYQPLGTVANKQARVAGINITGGYATFPGVLGTAVTRICRVEIGRTGLSERDAVAAGYGVVVATVSATTAAAYMPESASLKIMLTVERGTGRLLGGQLVGGPGAAKRVDVLAAAVAGGLTAEDLVGLDLGYAPPFSSVWDPLQTAARQALAQLGAA